MSHLTTQEGKRYAAIEGIRVLVHRQPDQQVYHFVPYAEWLAGPQTWPWNREICASYPYGEKKVRVGSLHRGHRGVTVGGGRNTKVLEKPDFMVLISTPDEQKMAEAEAQSQVEAEKKAWLEEIAQVAVEAADVQAQAEELARFWSEDNLTGGFVYISNPDLQANAEKAARWAAEAQAQAKEAARLTRVSFADYQRWNTTGLGRVYHDPAEYSRGTVRIDLYFRNKDNRETLHYHIRHGWPTQTEGWSEQVLAEAAVEKRAAAVAAIAAVEAAAQARLAAQIVQ